MSPTVSKATARLEWGFERIVIIGLGLIGGSLGLAIKSRKFPGTVVGVDMPEVLEFARNRDAIDEAYDPNHLEQALQGADLVFLCTPVQVVLELLPKIGPYLKSGTLVTDVGSTKRRIIEAADRYLPASCDFIGGHPMTGAEKRGIEAADPFLFENTTYVLTPSRPVQAESRKAFGELLEHLGAKVLLLLPRLHDEIAAAVSHLPQLAAVSLMNMVARHQSESPHFLKMAAGGFRDMTRIASSPFEMWQHILESNTDMVHRFIELYIEELRHVKSLLDSPELSAYFDGAARSRLSIPKDTKGFLKPQFDISVVVEDKPGVIALIATTCADNHINIKDIEVLKIRENDGGTMRLAFASESDREQAMKLLHARGLECHKR